MASKKPTVVAWLLSGGALALGLLLVFAQLKNHLPTESDLFIVEGTPTDEELVEMPGRHGKVSYVVKFKLGGHALEWSDKEPRFHYLVEVLKRDIPVKAWLAAVRRGFVTRTDLYQLEADGAVMITYAEVVAHEREQGSNIPWLCGFFLLAGVAGLAACIYFQRK